MTRPGHLLQMFTTYYKSIDYMNCNNFVEANCYGIGGAGQLLRNHVTVETDCDVQRFDSEGLRQLHC